MDWKIVSPCFNRKSQARHWRCHLFALRASRVMSQGLVLGLWKGWEIDIIQILIFLCIAFTKDCSSRLCQDIQIRLRSLPPPSGLASYPIRIQEPFLIPQLSQLLLLLTKCVDIVEMSTVTGDSHNGPFIAGQLGILADTLDDARHVLKGGEETVGVRWWEDHLQSTVCWPPPINQTKAQTYTAMYFSAPCSSRHFPTSRSTSPSSIQR